jgi:hypothetical protein
MAFESWRRWILFGSVFFAIFGVVAAVAPHSVVFEIWINGVDRVFFEGRIPPEARAMRGLLMGPLGGTIAGLINLVPLLVFGVPLVATRSMFHEGPIDVGASPGDA